MLSTELTRVLGIKHPVIGAAMMWLGVPKLAAAVSNAGGLGMLTGLTAGSPEGLRAAIRETKKLTSKPFGVNLTFLPSVVPPPFLEYAKVVFEEGIKVAETAGGPQANAIIKYYKENGIYVIHKVTSIRHARSAVKAGANCLSIDGFECAGHPGEDDIGGLVLLALAQQANLGVPYVASGGIANGAGLAAALSLGAIGINCGTLFMCTEECTMDKKIKEAMVKASERDTTHIFRTLGNTARVFKNEIAMEVRELEKKGAKFPEIQSLVSGARGKTVYELGDVNAGVWSCSPVVGLIHDIPTCEVLVSRIVADAEAIIVKNSAMIVKAKL